uniref:Uncharacterized protein n=1 Tax=Cucumis melo TaxID=3656 RepID=A0A9I9E6C4_CUCME
MLANQMIDFLVFTPFISLFASHFVLISIKQFALTTSSSFAH